MFNGRTGFDALSVTTLILAVVFAVLASVIENQYYQMIPAITAIALAAYTVFRVLSTNVAKRRYEADRFTSFFKKDPYKRFKCPKCKTLCRVPRNKGKIKIHCPSCGHEFIKRT